MLVHETSAYILSACLSVDKEPHITEEQCNYYITNYITNLYVILSVMLQRYTST